MVVIGSNLFSVWINVWEGKMSESSKKRKPVVFIAKKWAGSVR